MRAFGQQLGLWLALLLLVPGCTVADELALAAERDCASEAPCTVNGEACGCTERAGDDANTCITIDHAQVCGSPEHISCYGAENAFGEGCARCVAEDGTVELDTCADGTSEAAQRTTGAPVRCERIQSAQGTCLDCFDDTNTLVLRECDLTDLAVGTPDASAGGQADAGASNHVDAGSWDSGSGGFADAGSPNHGGADAGSWDAGASYDAGEQDAPDAGVQLGNGCDVVPYPGGDICTVCSGVPSCVPAGQVPTTCQAFSNGCTVCHDDADRVVSLECPDDMFDGPPGGGCSYTQHGATVCTTCPGEAEQCVTPSQEWDCAVMPGTQCVQCTASGTPVWQRCVGDAGGAEAQPPVCTTNANGCTACADAATGVRVSDTCDASCTAGTYTVHALGETIGQDPQAPTVDCQACGDEGQCTVQHACGADPSNSAAIDLCGSATWMTRPVTHCEAQAWHTGARPAPLAALTALTDAAQSPVLRVMLTGQDTGTCDTCDCETGQALRVLWPDAALAAARAQGFSAAP